MTFNDNDPFGFSPSQPEPEPAPEPIQAHNGIVPVPFSGKPASAEAISVTLKGSAGHDAPWIVVKGGSAAEVKQALQDVAQSELMAMTAAAAKAFREFNGAPANQAAPQQRKANNGWQTQNQQATPAAPSAQQHPTGEACPHGVLTYTSWRAKDGSKTFEAYKCPNKVANYRDPNSCERTVWADKVKASSAATPPF
jgi:hypothetical protein